MQSQFQRFCFLIISVLICVATHAEEPVVVKSTSSISVPPTRPRLDDLQKASSSFVADPDPLDPLPLKNESLKEDDEPVLEDIRGILKAPKTKKTTVSPTQKPVQSEKVTTDSDDEIKPKVQIQKKIKNTVKVKKITKLVAQQKKNKKIKSVKSNRNPDEPDLNYENKLNQIYKTYNINPTSAEVWSKVTSERKVETFIVEKGNTLESISRILFGDSQFWPKIWALNHQSISNPHQIYPGQKIYFFPATESDLPTISIDQTVDLQIASFGKSLDGRDYNPQMTEFEKMNRDYVFNKKNKIDRPQPVPESLPMVRNKNYFIPKKTDEVRINITDRQVLATVDPANPYVLSSSILQTDFSVAQDQVDDLVCNAGQFVKVVNKVNAQAAVGSYMFVEPLTTTVSHFKKTFVYKVIGQAEIDDKNQMRIKSCQSLLNSKTLIVSNDKLQSLPEPTESMGKGPQLIESLEAENLDFFNFGQLMVINTESEKPNQGQSLDIYSEAVGAVVGKMKILKNTGTFSIGYLTEISHLIKIGDQVLINPELQNKTVESPSLDSELKIE